MLPTSTFPITSSPFPATFEQYAAENNITANLDGWRVVYERDRLVESLAPASVPPCPAWCTLPAGHDYDSTDGYEPGEVTFMRNHLAWSTAHTQVDATEESLNGTITLRPADVLVTVRDDGYSAEAVRALAAELLEAAAVLDGLSQ